MSETFYCKTLRCSGVTIETCIRRQFAKAKSGNKCGGATPYVKYPECRKCKDGRRRAEAHPELVALAKKSKSVKPLNMRTPPDAFPTYYHKEPDLSRSVREILKAKSSRKRKAARKTIVKVNAGMARKRKTRKKQSESSAPALCKISLESRERIEIYEREYNERKKASLAA